MFDGHGPLGHKFAQCIRDNLPSKLSTTIKMSQQNVDGANATNKNTYDEDKQHLSCTSWEKHLFSSFNEMDEDLAKNIAKTDGFCGGSVAVTLIKQVNMSISSQVFVLCMKVLVKCSRP